MKVITIATVATALFFTTYTSLSACPTAWGLHQHACSKETIQLETNEYDYLVDETSQNDDDEDD